MKFKLLLTPIFLLAILHLSAQLMEVKQHFSRYDTLRGTINEYRRNWNVLKYELTVTPDFQSKSISGISRITYYEEQPVFTMQIDLQQPLIIDSVTDNNGNSYKNRRDSNVCFVDLRDSLAKYKFLPGVRSLKVYYHGMPKEAKRAPWDGGLVWKKDSLNNPWIATACQGLGASVWFPCKDHQSDEPDSGMTIHIIVVDSLKAISNGRLKGVNSVGNGMSSWTWDVVNPINNYDITMNVGKYANFTDTLMGEAGKLDLSYWVLDYNLEKAKRQFEQVKPMLRSHEYWFGKYPFYEDGYKLVETPFLGMEHQSAVAYGNKYMNGYLGRDLSGTGVGLKWDFIIIHESGHEWFGNNITTNDLADMWVHEGFTNYSETLYTDYHFGKEAGIEYCNGIRKNIRNDRNIIGDYGVNKEGSGDMYPKGANMLNIIRNTINDDNKFRSILRGLNSAFYHKTVNTGDIENYISQESGINFSPVFDQYLRTTTVPTLEYRIKGKNISFRWTNCIKDFNLPLYANNGLKMEPTNEWSKMKRNKNDNWQEIFKDILKRYYIQLKQVK